MDYSVDLDTYEINSIWSTEELADKEVERLINLDFEKFYRLFPFELDKQTTRINK
jgi:hypothetical protein